MSRHLGPGIPTMPLVRPPVPCVVAVPARDAGSHGNASTAPRPFASSCGAQHPFGLCSTCSCSTHELLTQPGELERHPTTRSTYVQHRQCSRPVSLRGVRLHHSPSVVAGAFTDDARLKFQTLRGVRCELHAPVGQSEQRATCTSVLAELAVQEEETWSVRMRHGHLPSTPGAGQGRLQTSGGRSGRTRGDTRRSQ